MAESDFLYYDICSLISILVRAVIGRQDIPSFGNHVEAICWILLLAQLHVGSGNLRWSRVYGGSRNKLLAFLQCCFDYFGL